MKKLLPFLAFVFVLAELPAVAQSNTGDLKGTVKDEAGTPVPFANVALFRGQQLITGAVADIDGIYQVKDISPGVYAVRVNSISHEQKTIEGINIRPNQIDTLNILLRIGTVLECITICEKRVAIDQTVQSSTFNRNDIQRLPSRNAIGVASITGGVNTRDGNSSVRGSRGYTSMYKNSVKVNPSPAIIQNQNNAKSGTRSTESNSINGKRKPVPVNNTEEYSDFVDNSFLSSMQEPLSTFSVDVDKASYTLVKRFISEGNEPPRGAVRLEEMVNYFNYQYPNPTDEHPFNIISEVTDCPWNSESRIVKIALQGKRIEEKSLPPSVFTFLVDVSGSMDSPNKLPLVKASLQKLLEKLRPVDKVGIVVYAGSAGVVLEPTSAGKKDEILQKITQMGAGGSTAGGAGIQAAYNLAEKNFVKDGNNRIILCTDGDFNVGVSSESGLAELIEQERKKGIFLTVLGFGMGNYKDRKLELLADKGNGNYAYIDDYAEAEKFLGIEFAGSMYTIAKDVKIQVEFNPAIVKSYRLIGYENRVLAAEDFNDDKKDAGEIGAGHTVTALYEIRADEKFCKKIDALKYRNTSEIAAGNASEIATVKFRYKKPDGDKSILITQTLNNQTMPFEKASASTRFAVSVASFGMKLRKSDYVKDLPLNTLIKIATDADPERDETKQAFIQMLKSYEQLSEIAKK